MINAKCGAVYGPRDRRSYLRVTPDTGQFIGIQVVYWIFAAPGDYEPPLENLVAQHNKTNRTFSGQNTDDLAKIPKTGNYAFADIIGNPKILFAPSNGDLYPSMIKRVSIEPNSISSTNPLESFIQLAGTAVVPKVINIFCGIIPPTQSGSILGQAYLGSNVLCVDSRTIGSPVVPGPLANYGTGATLDHELGHAVGNLRHTWVNPSDGGCGGDAYSFSDIPSSFLPSTNFELYQKPDGEWDGRYCNRWKDCQYYKNGSTDGIPTDDVIQYYSKDLPMSCFDCETTKTGCTDCTTKKFEIGPDIMNYGRDNVAIMLTLEQVKAMRLFCLSDQESFNIFPVDGGVVPTEPLPSNGSSGPSTETWLWISVGIVAAVILIAVVVSVVQQKKKAAKAG